TPTSLLLVGTFWAYVLSIPPCWWAGDPAHVLTCDSQSSIVSPAEMTSLCFGRIDRLCTASVMASLADQVRRYRGSMVMAAPVACTFVPGAPPERRRAYSTNTHSAPARKAN